MKRRLNLLMIGLATITILVAMSLESHAQCCRWTTNAGNGYGAGLFCANIPGLDDSQLEKVNALQREYAEDMQHKREALQEKRQMLNQLRAEKNVKLKNVNQAIDEVNALEADLAKRQAKYRDDVRQLLDDKQKAYFDDIQTRRAAFRADRGGRGLGPCGRAGMKP